MRILAASLMFSALAFSIPMPSHAEVKQAVAHGFEIESRVVVATTTDRAFSALGQIARWWDPDHTYSSSAANLRLGLTAGECFCEVIPKDGGSIEHGRVVYSRPGATLRVQTSLGPLQSEAVTGTLTWSFKKVSGGTEVTQSYVVGGFFRQSAERLAPLVDRVMSGQFSRFQKHLESGQ